MKALKWILVITGILILILGCAAYLLSSSATDRLTKVYDIADYDVEIVADSASLARGEHLAILCVECHGHDLGGMFFFEDESIATMHTPNITSGKGGKTGLYTDFDWVRTIRHGVRPDGTPLFIMGSKDFFHLNEADMGALIAYLKSVPPVDNDWPDQEYYFMGKVLVGAGAFGPEVISAEVIDHNAGFADAVPEGFTAEYGNYLVNISGCRTCHGAELNGFKDPDPNAPIAPNLTPGGDWGNWDTDQFIRTMRSGITPAEIKLDPKFMPWLAYMKYTDEELTAIDLYLQSLPAMDDGMSRE